MNSFKIPTNDSDAAYKLVAAFGAFLDALDDVKSVGDEPYSLDEMSEVLFRILPPDLRRRYAREHENLVYNMIALRTQEWLQEVARELFGPDCVKMTWDLEYDPGTTFPYVINSKGYDMHDAELPLMVDESTLSDVWHSEGMTDFLGMLNIKKQWNRYSFHDPVME